jgi:hypothetical protein
MFSCHDLQLFTAREVQGTDVIAFIPPKGKNPGPPLHFFKT